MIPGLLGTLTNQVETAVVSTPGNLLNVRNNYSGVLGFKFSIVGQVVVTALGRWAVTGNSKSHTVSIWTDDLVSVKATASVDCSDGAAGYHYASITPVFLPAGTYRIASQEVNSEDQWLDAQAVTTIPDVTLIAAVLGSPTPSIVGDVNLSYVPPTFKVLL